MSYLPARLMQCTLLHFEKGVPIDRLGLQSRGQADRLARVEYVFWQWQKNPFLDPAEMFRSVLRSKGLKASQLSHTAARDMLLFKFVIENIAPPSRKLSEVRVRAAGNKLIRMGMETDNGRDIESGAKILMKLDRLDQPENELADLSKAVFLPAVVVTNVQEVDPTKDDVDDAEVARIMSKYGGYVDEKRKLVEDKAAVMAMRGRLTPDPSLSKRGDKSENERLTPDPSLSKRGEEVDENVNGNDNWNGGDYE